MKVEKWIYKGKEIDVPILEEDEIEQNEEVDYLEKTIDIRNVLEKEGDFDDQL